MRQCDRVCRWKRVQEYGNMLSASNKRDIRHAAQSDLSPIRTLEDTQFILPYRLVVHHVAPVRNRFSYAISFSSINHPASQPYHSITISPISLLQPPILTLHPRTILLPTPPAASPAPLSPSPLRIHRPIRTNTPPHLTNRPLHILDPYNPITLYRRQVYSIISVCSFTRQMRLYIPVFSCSTL
jgi:hypothetical protein